MGFDFVVIDVSSQANRKYTQTLHQEPHSWTEDGGGGLKCKNFTTYPVSVESDLPILYRSFEIMVKLRWLSWERQTFAINQQLPYL